MGTVMTKKEQSIKIIFSIDNWQPPYDTEDKLMELKNTIPGSDYSYLVADSMSNNYVKKMQDAQKVGLAWEKMENYLYMIADDPDTIHFFAMHPDYEPLVKALDNLFRLDMFDPFNAVDMV